MYGAAVDNWLAPDEPSDLGDRVIQRRQPIAAEIDDFIPQRFHRRDGATGDVVDIGKIALLFPIAKHGNRLTFGNAANEAKHAHVWSPCRTIYREVANDADIDLVQMVISERHDFGR